MTSSNKAQIDALVHSIERAQLLQGGDETKLRRALSLAAEASRTPVSDRRDELVSEARDLLRHHDLAHIAITPVVFGASIGAAVLAVVICSAASDH